MELLSEDRFGRFSRVRSVSSLKITRLRSVGSGSPTDQEFPQVSPWVHSVVGARSPGPSAGILAGSWFEPTLGRASERQTCIPY